jgi:hypothetical protein
VLVLTRIPHARLLPGRAPVTRSGLFAQVS